MNFFTRLQELNIMLIEDDEYIRDSMRLLLEGEGCRLRTWDTAEEALADLEREMADVIIADYRLPRMDGIAFFEALGRRAGKQAVRVLISAYLNRPVRDLARRAGVQAMIEKPFTSETIETVLAKLLDERGKGDAGSPKDRAGRGQEGGAAV